MMRKFTTLNVGGAAVSKILHNNPLGRTESENLVGTSKFPSNRKERKQFYNHTRNKVKNIGSPTDREREFN